MGGLISLLRDIKTIYRDLKVTLKLTARIVIKVHGIVDDVERTVQELKTAVKGVSAKISLNGSDEVAFDALVENVESKAVMLKTSLIEATSQVFNEDLLKHTQEKWDKVMEYSRQSSEALTNIIASSSFYTSVVQGASDAAASTGVGEKNISFLDVKEKEEEDEKSNAPSNQAIVPVFNEPPSTISGVTEEDVRDFEILPSFDMMDSFWKCDIGCFNIDCVDLQQLPARQQRNGEVNGQLRKRKTKKRSGKSKLSKKTGISGTNSGHTPVKYHNHKQKRPRENIALEVIFLIALLVEGAAMSNNNLLARERLWNECNYGSYSSAAEILELDD